MCNVLGVARSTYYKSFDKSKSSRAVENEELKSAIIRIYKANKGIYGAPRIHHILKLKGFNVSLKRVQRRMTELGLCAITVKKYKPHSNKKVAEGLENVLKRDFTTTSINEKWVGDIIYISNDLKQLCKEFNITQSFSKKGCPYDNACIESFHSSIKKEEIYRTTYRTFEEANIAIFKYIEGWYNRKRLHSSINYMTPDQCELLARSVI